jgi:uncharacterized protein
MRLRQFTQLILATAFAATAHAAVSLPQEEDSALPLPAEEDGKVVDEQSKACKPAIRALQEKRYQEAIDLAEPLAEKGNRDALYLMGYVNEAGKCQKPTKEKAVEFYRKAAAAGQKDANLRIVNILLNSEKESDRDDARKLLESISKTDPGVGGRFLGQAYIEARLSLKPDVEKALAAWKSAAAAKDIQSIIFLARFYEGAFGFPEKRDIKESIAQYTKAASLGNGNSMSALGLRLLRGDESIRDEKKGREWLLKAIDAKDYSAYLTLGDYEEGTNKDNKAAYAFYQKGAEMNQGDCMVRTAKGQIEGLGTEKDLAAGTKLMEKAAAAGSAEANYNLAALTLTAEKPDIIAGYKYLLAAANGNSPDAQNELGLFYYTGTLFGKPADPAKPNMGDKTAATAWFTRAAQNNNAAALCNLAAFYEKGTEGLAKDYKAAATLYQRAALKGHGPSTYAVARFLRAGLIGDKPNPVQAWAIANIAEERGEKAATKLITDIAADFTDAQKTEAKQALEDIKSGKAAAQAAEAAKAEAAAKAEQKKEK